MLHLLERTRRVDRFVPASLFTSDLFVGFLNTIDAERDGDVQIRAFVEDPGHIRKYALMDLSVRHQVNRVKLVVLVKRTNDLRQVLSCERLAAGKNQHAEI